MPTQHSREKRKVSERGTVQSSTVHYSSAGAPTKSRGWQAQSQSTLLYSVLPPPHSSLPSTHTTTVNDDLPFFSFLSSQTYTILIFLSCDSPLIWAMGILHVENHFHIALLSINIPPSTFLALAVLFFAYHYFLRTRNTPHSTRPIQQPIEQHGNDNRRAGRPVRRTSIFRRFSARLRTNKQRDRPLPPVWLSFASLGLPFRNRLGDGRIGFGRQIQ